MKRNCYILVLFFISLVMHSCTRDFEQLNTDPTKGASIAPGQQLAAAAYYMTGGRETGYPNLYLFLPRVQYVNGAWGMRSGTKYIRNDFYNDRIWEIYYGKSIKQLADMIARCKDDQDLVNYIAAARILKVYLFSVLTDCYGDIPYSQAGVAYYQKVYTPVYDRQQDIYHDFFKELDEAVKQFDASKQAIANDIVYNGAIEKWKKLANSLRLRLAVRLSNVDPTTAAQEAAAAYKGGLMQSSDDNFRMLHEAFNFPDLRGNGLSQSLSESDTYKYTIGCSTFTDYLKAEQDPRIASFFVNKDANGNDITSLTNYFSIQPGLYWWDQWADFVAKNGTVIPHGNKFCTINPVFSSLGASFLHMGYAETEFLLAEAAAKNWIAEDANVHYQRGIRAAMKQLEMYPGMPAINQQQVDDFVNAHVLSAGKAIEQINMQKWVALFPNGAEAFANQRRSGFPALQPVQDVGGESETNKKPFKRLFYPGTEAYNNTTNYQDALNRIGGQNDWMKPVWWDKQ
ncbi:MAG: SusD/RagB family nutrient-binding outer membrane lipoprotein [Chitinophaga sp.]|uniref:SusD/RagB family nutrient-binding outer membrane lipoprotein n=1 Tax=Chitinophaga sp. TaxID=1869181 RepID=UPI0025B8C1AE|nr:SusD/RagB family nutrient-binding outer membrane lipoprotein [Chitinophaga sp.]MBV8253115.1 SusD/RagB family nutrient-binding outer membrane lipoprotein [Chitinophaga sp.]